MLIVNTEYVEVEFAELLRRLKSIPWMKNPYRGLMKKVAEESGVPSESVSTKVFRDKNKDMAIRLAQLLNEQHERIKTSAAQVGRALRMGGEENRDGNR